MVPTVTNVFSRIFSANLRIQVEMPQLDVCLPVGVEALLVGQGVDTEETFSVMKYENIRVRISSPGHKQDL